MPPLTSTQEEFLARWLKKQKGPRALRNYTPPSPSSIKKEPNPKWNDDEGFEKQFGDPDYYKRIKGLD
jgi:hypothetical protein